MLEEIVEPLVTWDRKGHRILPWRQQKNPYYIWISEIMLQQTRVEAVKPYFERFTEALPDVEAAAAGSEYAKGSAPCARSVWRKASGGL